MRTDEIPLDKKRMMVRTKADRQRECFIIFTWQDDIEPKLLCDVPLRFKSENMDIVEYIYPRH